MNIRFLYVNINHYFLDLGLTILSIIPYLTAASASNQKSRVASFLTCSAVFPQYPPNNLKRISFTFCHSAQSISADSLEQWTHAIDYPLPLYAAKASANLLEKFKPLNAFEGITLTAPGFYAPQGRTIRMHSIRPDFLQKVAGAKLEGQEMTNIEMETAAYYAFAGAMGHEMISLNAILANRLTHEFSKNPEGQIKQLIELTLDLIA